MRAASVLKNSILILIPVIFLGLLFISFPFIVLASETEGTIDENYKYAWSENTGWINFGCDSCNVHITDSGLSGYAWGENIGWIYLNNIVNDGEGNLSGYAWSENIGWINLNPSYGGVTINTSGEFLGYAWGENIGWINFNQLKTDWRPISQRNESAQEESSPPSSGGGGGGGGGGGYYPLPLTFQKGDANKDGKVDILDFNILMVNWGRTNFDNIADFDKDNKVDILDFNILMVNWTK